MIRTVGIVIPAANEEDSIGACLSALTQARRHLRRVAAHDIDVRILVVLDSCTDRTASIVALHDVERLTCVAGRVGAAREAGVERLLTDAGVRSSELWLANTDADSTVPREWLAGMLEEADRGAHLVLGTVLPGPGLEHATQRLWARCHHLRENHPHVHGANFGIRADSYSALGGWPPLSSGEDVALAQRATRAAHLRVVRTASIPVWTSTRVTGRAPRGFSSYLRGLTATPSP
ncbi:MAG TPA: glycosyltransferase [Mycobacteriales bacterium]|nr:glycosyltransferase [Mycobacteriales bacterium]